MSELFTFPDPTSMPPPRRVIMHWTAGKYLSTADDRHHYHALIEWDDGMPKVVAGVPIVNNLHQLTADSPTHKNDPLGYAPHTRGMNSWSVGYSICAMWGAIDRDNLGDYPLLPEQVDALITLCAQTAAVFGMEVSEDTFFTHYEAQSIHGVEQRGKWDITYMPNQPGLEADQVGSWLRQQIGSRL